MNQDQFKQKIDDIWKEIRSSRKSIETYADAIKTHEENIKLLKKELKELPCPDKETIDDLYLEVKADDFLVTRIMLTDYIKLKHFEAGLDNKEIHIFINGKQVKPREIVED